MGHGYTEAEILHAFRNALRIVLFEYQGEERVLVIGPAPDGTLMELVAVPADAPARIIHADTLRPKFFSYLTR